MVIDCIVNDASDLCFDDEIVCENNRQIVTLSMNKLYATKVAIAINDQIIPTLPCMPTLMISMNRHTTVSAANPSKKFF